MGTRPIGNVTVLDGSIQALTDIQIHVNSVTLRSEQGNAIIYLYDGSGAVKCGYILQGESISLDIVSPHRIKIQGTEGQCLYWMGVTE